MSNFIFPLADISKFVQLISNAKRITILSHINADGDAVGSTTAMAKLLSNAGKETAIILPNPYPEILRFLDVEEKILIYKDNEEQSNKILRNSDLIILMDVSGMGRLEYVGKCVNEIVATQNIPKVLIDHHLLPEQDFDLIFSYTEISSTCELLFYLIEQMDFVDKICQQVATSIYAGIITDTHFFRHNSSRAELYVLISRLMNCGIDKSKIDSRLSESYSADRLQLLAFALHERLKFIANKKVAYMYLTQEELERYNFQPGDTDGLVNLPLSVESVQISALFTEASERKFIRVSLRSKDDFSVNEFARKYFHGGGHFNAAGGKFFETDMNRCIDYFEKAIDKSI